ncbi:transcriptional regulator domain-containing protein [Sphingomonas sp. BE137]|uniref:transcriptional regulator domain-containing protein n=1 Tax=Sphingomonas sp. BE137 TaxID=2817844 RepID=UPI003863CAE3
MWEWLRRDPDYIAWHVRASTATRGVSRDPLQWGLHFRGESEPRCARGPDHLACRSRSGNDCRRRHPRGSRGS